MMKNFPMKIKQDRKQHIESFSCYLLSYSPFQKLNRTSSVAFTFLFCRTGRRILEVFTEPNHISVTGTRTSLTELKHLNLQSLTY